jgi:ribosomal protein S18 acetylase RimI-like enzyme
MQARLPNYFSHVPPQKLEVARVPTYAEAASSGAYYNRASFDGRRPGTFFANLRDEPVGYYKLNERGAQTVLPNDEGMEIERIYIDQAFKEMGIGSLLISKAVESGTESGAKYLWLGVWEYNKPAIRFYEKNRFKIFSHHIFKLGDDPQTDLLMKRELQ